MPTFEFEETGSRLKINFKSLSDSVLVLKIGKRKIPNFKFFNFFSDQAKFFKVSIDCSIPDFKGYQTFQLVKKNI